MYLISRKNLLAKNVKKLKKILPRDFNFTPKTWLIPTEYSELRNYINQKGEFNMIVKPEALSQGKGIYITKKLEDISPGVHCVV